MRRLLPWFAPILAAFLTLFPRLALGNEPNQRRGTHFLGELSAGAHVQGAGGFTYGGLLGFGGNPRDIPGRFYLVVGAHRSHDVLKHTENDTKYHDDLQLTDVDFGLRAYFPIARGWRITAETLVGATFADGKQSNQALRTHQNATLPHLTLGIGPQVRLIHELSVGLMARTTFADTENVRSTGALSTWKSSLGRRTKVLSTFTFHF